VVHGLSWLTVERLGLADNSGFGIASSCHGVKLVWVAQS
jgi:hypothetical protein